MVDIVIKNSKLVFAEGIINGGVAIEGEKIVTVATDDNLPRARRTINARGRYLIPGVIDPHIHLASRGGTPGYGPPGQPVLTVKEAQEIFEEDCRTNSVVGAITGVTTFGHFIHTGPKGKTNLGMARSYKDCAERNMMTDIFFHVLISNDEHIEEIPKLAEEGVTSVKVMYNAYKGPDGLRPTLCGLEDEQMLRVIEKVADVIDLGYQACVMFHAENQDMIYKIRDKFKATGRNDLAVWSDGSPRLVELEMMRRAINMVKAIKIIRTPPPLYVCHMTLGEDVDIIAETRAEGEVKIACETGPQWLLLTKDDKKLGSLGKLNPPLRDKKDGEKLWVGLREGLIDCIGTDNLVGMKMSSKPADIWKASAGFPGEAALPLLLSEGVNKGRISFPKLVEVMCLNPARVFGLYPKKGVIAPGSDADLVLVDLKKRQRLTQETIKSPAEFSCFDGWNLTGWPVMTMVRGQVVFEEGNVVGKLGTGKYLPRTKA